MVSARWIAIALAAVAVGAGGAGAQEREQTSSNFNPLVQRGSPPKAGADRLATAAKPSKGVASPAAPAGSSDAAVAIAIGPPARPAPPASPVAVETVASTPAAGKTPLGLSQDAPDKAPSIGVIGGDTTGKGGGSVAATPEPSTLLLMGAGLAGIYRLRRRR